MKKTRAYIAGPLFSDQDRGTLEAIAHLLSEMDVAAYLPHRDAGDLGNVQIDYGQRKIRDELFDKDVEAVKQADFVIALLDGPDIDSGTALEMGIAHALGKPIIGFKSDFHRRNRTINNMVWGACSRGETLTFDFPGLKQALESLLELRSDGRGIKKR